MEEYTKRIGDPAAIAMETALGFARLVELVARTHALDPGKNGLDHVLLNLQNHAQHLGDTDCFAALAAARGGLRHGIEYPDTPKL